MPLHTKSLRIVGIVFALYAGLVATHQGEFWPFSIYPMFSQAGHPWTKVVVREVERGAPQDGLWREASMAALPGQPVALQAYGIDQNDVSQYVARTERWGREEIRSVRTLFARHPTGESNLLILRVKGRLDETDEVQVTATPLLLIATDTTYLRPRLSTR